MKSKITSTRMSILVLCLLVALTPRLVAAQDTFANVFASVQAPSSFAFPLEFHATRAIAIYDTNHNGFLDTANRNPILPFPFNFTAGSGLGSWIGSPFVVPGPQSDIIQLAALGKFCGDILIYAEQVDQANNIAYFLWFAVPDPNRPPQPLPCNPNFPVDFGLGSYQNSYASPTNRRHASFFGGLIANPTLGGVHMSIGQPGTPANPGHIFSTSPDPTDAWPAALSGFVAAEIGAFGDTLLPVSNIFIDVPLINESQWDGQSFFTTAFPFGRTIQPSVPSPVTLSASLWSTAMADRATPYNRDQYKSIKFADVNGDGTADLCYRDVSSDPFSITTQGSMRCALSNGSSFSSSTIWTTAFSGSWSSNEYYWGTIKFTDVNGDGRADVCGRGAVGIYCALSDGTSFGPATLWSAQYSNANNWQSDSSYWSTIQFADIDGDGRADVCGRGAAGMVCATSNGTAFVNVAVWTTQFSDIAGWRSPQYYSTIQLADIDADGKADVCGRGSGGFYCGLSTRNSFTGTSSLYAPAFSDANGWNAQKFYQSLWLIDVNGDGNADICGRGNGGIYCALSMAANGGIAFQPVMLWANNFGDNYGWGTAEAYWGTVQPAHAATRASAGFCGRGNAGILCISR